MQNWNTYKRAQDIQENWNISLKKDGYCWATKLDQSTPPPITTSSSTFLGLGFLKTFFFRQRCSDWKNK